MKKILTIAVITAALVIVALVLVWKFVPSGTVERLAGESEPAKAILCGYPVQVSGDAMAPIFRHGERVVLSKCVEGRESLVVGMIILYERPGGNRLSVIRDRVVADDGGVLYRVSQEARQNDIEETQPDRILAVYED